MTDASSPLTHLRPLREKRRDRTCSKCGHSIPEEHVPLILWNETGHIMWVFCGNCDAAILGISGALGGQVKASYCSFCGKANHGVELMLAGPGMAFICNECIALAVELIAAKKAEAALKREREHCAACLPQSVELRR